MKTTFLVCYPNLCCRQSLFAQQTQTHTSTAENISANSSFLDIAAIKGNPSAVITVDPDADTRIANPHPLGVWYDGSRWAVFNQDKAVMKAGLKFLVRWSLPGTNSYHLKANNSNLQEGLLLLDHPALNNNPGARFSLSQLWNPGGAGGMYNLAEVTTEYEPELKRWLIMNNNGEAITSQAWHLM
jgi:hypothetical protein